MNIKRLLPFAALCVIAASCSDRTPRSHISRLDTVMAAYKDMPDSARAHVLDSLAPEIGAMMQVLGVDSVDDSVVKGWSYSAAVSMFTPAVDSVYADVTAEEEALGRIASRAEAEGLELPRRHFVAVVWGMMKSVVLNDSVMLIALNHYLGPDYDGYSHWDSYRRQTKSRSHLPFDLAEAQLAVAYPYDDRANAPAIDRLLYEGALAYARLRLAAADPDDASALAESLGYTPDQLRWLQDNERQIWTEMSRRRLIYDTNPTVADRLVEPSPATTLIHPDAPGRAGRYIGLRIVDSYLRANPDATLPHLLSPEFYHDPSALVKSAYKP